MKRAVCFTVTALLALAALPAAGSTFVAMSQQEMVGHADAVVQGRVVGLESFWSASGRIIVTEAVVAVDEVVAGEAPAQVRVRTFGGQVGDVTVEAHGFPVFEQGERVILFLARERSDGSLRVVGYQQGHYRVVTRLDGVTLAVPQVEEGVRLLTPSGRLAPAAQSVLIDDFKASVRRDAMQRGRELVK